MIREGRNAIRPAETFSGFSSFAESRDSFVVIGYDSAVMTCGI
jgi:hypothetical protein